MSDKIQHDCGYLLEATMTYCPRCGKKVFEATRSCNEIKILIKQINDLVDRNKLKFRDGNEIIQVMSIVMPVILALEWAGGIHDESPLTLLKKIVETGESQTNEDQGD